MERCDVFHLLFLLWGDFTFYVWLLFIDRTWDDMRNDDSVKWIEFDRFDKSWHIGKQDHSNSTRQFNCIDDGHCSLLCFKRPFYRKLLISVWEMGIIFKEDEEDKPPNLVEIGKEIVKKDNESHLILRHVWFSFNNIK